MSLAGAWMIFHPDSAARWMPELRENSTPAQTRRNAQWTGVALVFFGWACLHLVFVEGLKPFPPGENGVGF